MEQQVRELRPQPPRQAQTAVPSPIAQLDHLQPVPVSYRRLNLFKVSFFVFVLLPTLVAAAYSALVAPNEYAANSKFVVRTVADDNPYVAPPRLLVSASAAATGSPGASASGSSTGGGAASSGGGGLLGGKTAASQEAYIVADYIRSRTIIQDLGGKEILYDIYSRPDIGWISRLDRPVSMEAAWEYWNKKIKAIIDTQSNIISLSVLAFTPEDARRLSKLILERCEALANDISRRSRTDALGRAEGEVEKAKARLAKARQALLEFRNNTSAVNPVLSAASLGDTILQQIREKIALDANRDSLEGLVTADSPTRRLLDAQIETKAKQIAELKEQLTSNTRKDAISRQIAQYESLELESQFAQNLYSTAQTAYEAARVRVERQQMYVSPIVSPALPEATAHPRLFVDTSLCFVIFLVGWSMVSLVVAAVRDHIDFG